MLKLFYNPGSCALASLIALEDSGAAYEVVRVDLRANEQRAPAYLAINPKGRVPALATERGVLSETPAILAYLAQSYPEAKLAPLADPFEFARVQAFTSYLCSTVHVAFAHRMRGARWADDPAAIEEMRRKAPSVAADCIALIEREMLLGPWVMGDAYTVCDPYLFTIARWLERDGMDARDYPSVYAHRQRMEARSAVQRALAIEHA